MFKGFWELMAAFRYKDATQLQDLTRAAIIWLCIIVATFIFMLVSLVEGLS